MIPGLASQSSVLRPTALDGIEAITLLAVVVLGVVTSLLVPVWLLACLLILISAALAWTGLSAGQQWAATRPWLPVILFVLVVHVFTTTSAAPLGHASWGGLAAGVEAVGRIAVSLGFLSLFSRLKSVDDLVAAVRWWLRPLELLGLPVGQLALVLAVALGTIPSVMNEGRRTEAVLRMRRAKVGSKGASFVRKFLDRIVVVVPLSESLIRRAEVLSLSLRTRQPSSHLVSNPPLGQLAFLFVWAVLLVGGVWWGGAN